MSIKSIGNIELVYGNDCVVDSQLLVENLNEYIWIEGFWEVDETTERAIFVFADDNEMGSYFLRTLDPDDELEDVEDSVEEIARSICPCIKSGSLELVSVQVESWGWSRFTRMKFFNSFAEFNEVIVSRGSIDESSRIVKFYLLEKI